MPCVAPQCADRRRKDSLFCPQHYSADPRKRWQWVLTYAGARVLTH